MKVAILTFARTNNYGATLQCYALNKYIQSLGHETIILNVPLDDGLVHSHKKTNIITRSMRFIKKILRRIITSIKTTSKFKEYETRYSLTPEQRAEEQRYSDINMKLFDDFRSQYLTNITKEYFNSADFEADYPVADAYVVGSDQVWNLKITRWQYPIFFFSFVKDGSKRISYAACMGGDGNVTYNLKKKKHILSMISKFDNISVRNEMAINIFRNNFELIPTQVLDPTFLIDSYDELLKDSDLDASGCLYCDKFIINDLWVYVIRHLSKENSLNIRLDNCLIPIRDIPFKPECTIQEWLKLIKTSEFIFTDSFHCIVFCILFRKQFIVAPSYKGGEGRMLDLLIKLGIEERFYNSPDEILSTDRWKQKIDYDKVFERVTELRKQSREYLKQALV